MAEGCQKILSEITKMKVMPDADMNFLASLEGNVISYLKAPTPDATDQMGNSVAQSPLAGAMGQVMGGAPMGGGGPAAQPMMQAPLGSPDEALRMLGHAARRSSIHDIAAHLNLP